MQSPAPSRQRILQPQICTVPRLRNPDLENYLTSQRFLVDHVLAILAAPRINLKLSYGVRVSPFPLE